MWIRQGLLSVGVLVVLASCASNTTVRELPALAVKKSQLTLPGSSPFHLVATVVSAIFDPGSPLQGVDLTKSDDNPVRNVPLFCRRFATPVGIAPVSNDVFSTYCFKGGLLEGVNLPGYVAGYDNYAPFSDKQV